MEHSGTDGCDGPHQHHQILLVEDDLDNADAMRSVLELWGYWVDLAHASGQAFVRAESNLPDCVVVDLGLPTFAVGCSLVKRLRALPGADAMLVIATTGYGSESDRRDAIGAGCDFFFVKPADLDELRDALRSIDLHRDWVNSARAQ